MLKILIYVALAIDILLILKFLLALIVLYFKKAPFIIDNQIFGEEEIRKIKMGMLALLLVLLAIAWALNSSLT